MAFATGSKVSTLSFSTLIFLFITEVSCQSCPTGWIQRPGTYDCYLFRTDARTWDDGRSACTYYEGDLTSIDKGGEYEWIEAQLNDLAIGQDFWIGLADTDGTLTYTWSDGAIYDPNLSYWANHEPSHSKGNHACVAMATNQHWGWIDADCTTNKAFICHRTLTDIQNCDEENGWVKNAYYCYYTSTRWLTFDNAQEYCGHYDASLMSVRDDDEQQYLAERVKSAKSDLWIGYKSTSGKDGFKWSDGETTVYEHWDTGEPGESPEMCTMVEYQGGDTGNWTSTDCYQNRHFECKKLSGSCYPGWRIHKGYCYQMIANQPTTWVDAKIKCEAKGATLLTVLSEQEQDFMNEQLPSLSQAGVSNIWLGISDTINDGVMKWSDGTAYDDNGYKNWPAHTTPVNKDNEAQCGSIYTGSSIGQWDYGDCFNMFDYVCKTKEGAAVTPVDPDKPKGYCPPDWFYYNDFCYYVNETEGTTYTDAEQTCVSFGGHLTSILSAGEMSFIELRLGSHDYYIGLHRKGQGGFEWDDGSVFLYNNWDIGEPNNAGSGEDCVHVRGPYTTPSGVWNDISCDRDYSFICKIPAETSTPPPPTNPTNVGCYDPYQMYIGNAQITVDGDACLYWKDMTDREYNPVSHPEARLEENYCRNPDNGPSPWCYVEFGQKACDVPQCNAPKDCYEGDGYLYRGKTAATVDGTACLAWGSLDGSAYYRPDKYPEEGLDNNYCRNPSGATFGPWCYYQKNTFGYSLASCGIPKCNTTGCYEGAGGNYRGTADMSEDGKVCAKWNDTRSMPVNPLIYPDSGLDHNYCRNPDLDTEPWCYVQTDQSTLIRAYCGVPHCSAEVGCFVGKGMSYRGKANYVTTGRTCSDWVDFIDEFYPVSLNEFSVLTNYALRPVGDSRKAISLEECAHWCLHYPVFFCKSFSYYPGTMTDGSDSDCMVSSLNRQDGSLIPDGQQDYYERNQTYGLEENYCRNPNEAMAPWCYFYDALHNQTDWAYCVVPECNPEDVGCYNPKDSGQSYRGGDRTTANGEICLEWTETYYTPERYPNSGLEENYCRNPSTFRTAPFCLYQGTHGMTSGYCDIPECDIKEICDGDDWKAGPSEEWCYKINTETSLTFDQALDDCTDGGGSLTSITSDAESAFLAGLVADSIVVGFWIGANDLFQEAGWEWTDGSPFAFLNWKPGQPDNLHDAEQCALMSSANGQWTDENCDLSYPHICKKPSLTRSISTVAPTTEAPGSRCPMDWVGYGSHCYLVQPDFVGWKTALFTCERLGGTLATVHSDGEMQHIASMMSQASRQYYFFGANDVQKQDQWTYGNGTNDTPLTYTNWAEGQPDNMGASGEDCVAVDFKFNWKWNDDVCEKKYQVVCENENNGGDANFGRYSAHYDTMTYADAQTHCVKYEGTMATVKNAKDTDDLETLLNMIYDPFHPGIFWIGVNDLQKEGHWVTGGNSDSTTEQTYFDWRPEEPNDNKAGGEHCGMMAPVDDSDPDFIQFEWYDWSCDNAERFICENIDPNSRYTGSEGRTFSPVNEPMTWKDASSYCQSKGGRLAQVKDQWDQNNFDYMLSENRENLLSSKGAWIGLNDISRQMNFEWADGSKVTYTNWNAGEPDDFSDSQDCVFAYSQNGKDNTGRKYYAGKWADYDCETEDFGYVCSKGKGNFAPSEIPPPEYDCPLGWFGSDTYCYLLLDEHLTWEDARDKCASYMDHGEPTNTTLVYIPNYVEQDVIAVALEDKTGMYWIGLSDPRHGQQTEYEWVTGQPVTFAEWDGDQPGNLQHSCVAMSDQNGYGLWDDQSCDSKYAAICQKPRRPDSAPDLPPTPPPTGSCPTGWSVFDAYCYLVVHVTGNQTKDLFSASDYCYEQTANYASLLLSLHSRKEEEFVMDLVQNSNPSVDPSEGFWMGMQAYSGPAYFNWFDGSAVQYVNWGTGMPEKRPQDSTGLVMYPADDGRGWEFISQQTKRSWICKTPRGTEIVTTIAPVSPGTSPLCGEGDTYKDWSYNPELNTCYKFMGSDQDNRVSWTEALGGCAGENSDLVSIHSSAENSFVQQLVAMNDIDAVWLGMVDLATRGGFGWSDGSPAQYFNWADHEPGNAVTSCTKMDAVTGGWKLEECDSQVSYMCKKTPGVDNYTPAPTQRADGFCPKNWFTWGNKCLQFQDRMDTWTNSRNACQTLGGDLISIRDHLEQNYIVTLLESVSDQVWIGLTDRDHEGLFEWSDGTNVYYTNWYTNEPNDMEDNENCVHMYGSSSPATPGSWNDAECTQRYQALCSIPRDPNGTPVAPTLSLCGSYHHYGNGCYKVYNGSYTRKQAQDKCADDGLGATLASINSIYEQREMELLIQRSDIDVPVYIGLTYANHTYKWDDGWPVMVTNWAHGEPSNEAGEACVALNNDDGLWSDVACDTKYAALCKWSHETPPYHPTLSPEDCPGSDWTVHGSACYKAYLDDEYVIPWSAASYVCHEDHAYLVSIHSEEEKNVVLSLAPDGIYSVWTGLSNLDDLGWSWEDESPVEYVNFAPGEPSGINGDNQDEQCVQMYTSGGHAGQWNDLYCLEKWPFICKYTTGEIGYRTTPLPEARQGSSLGVGAIVGISVGAFLVVLLIVILFVGLRRQKRMVAYFRSVAGLETAPEELFSENSGTEGNYNRGGRSDSFDDAMLSINN